MIIFDITIYIFIYFILHIYIIYNVCVYMYARAYVFKENIVKKNKKEKYFIFIILNLMKIKKRTYFKSIKQEQ